MSADAQWEALERGLLFRQGPTYEAFTALRARQQRQDEEIERLREANVSQSRYSSEQFVRAQEAEARVQQLEDALREAADRFAAIAQGKTADMHEAVAARAEQAARAALDETEVLNDRI